MTMLNKDHPSDLNNVTI